MTPINPEIIQTVEKVVATNPYLDGKENQPVDKDQVINKMKLGMESFFTKMQKST